MAKKKDKLRQKRLARQRELESSAVTAEDADATNAADAATGETEGGTGPIRATAGLAVTTVKSAVSVAGYLGSFVWSASGSSSSGDADAEGGGGGDEKDEKDEKDAPSSAATEAAVLPRVEDDNEEKEKEKTEKEREEIEKEKEREKEQTEKEKEKEKEDPLPSLSRGEQRKAELGMKQANEKSAIQETKAEEEIRKLKEDLDTLRGVARENKRLWEEVRDEAQTNLDDLGVRLAESEVVKDEAVMAVEDTARKAKEEIGGLVEELDKVREEVEEAKRLKDEGEKASKEELDDLKARLVDSEGAKVVSTRKAAEAEETAGTNTEAELKELRDNRKVAEERIGALEEEVARAEKVNRTHTDELEIARSQLGALDANMEQAKRIKEEAIKQTEQTKMFKDAFEAAQSTVTDLREELTSTQARADHLAEEVMKGEAEQSRLAKETDHWDELKRVRSSNADLASSLVEAQAEVSAMAAAATTAAKATTERQKAVRASVRVQEEAAAESSRKRLMEAEKKISRLKAELDEVRKEGTDMEAELEAINARKTASTHTLRDLLAGAKREAEESRTKLKEMTEERRSLAAKAVAGRTEMERLRGEIRRAWSAFADLSKRLEERSTEARRLEGLRSKHEKELEGIRTTLDKDLELERNTIKDLGKIIKSTTSRTDSLMKMIEEGREENERLRKKAEEDGARRTEDAAAEMATTIRGLRKELERALEREQKGGRRFPPQLKFRSQSRSQEGKEDNDDNIDGVDDEDQDNKDNKVSVLQKQKEASDWNAEMLEMALAGAREEAALSKEASSRQLVCMSAIEVELEEELANSKKELDEAKEEIKNLQKNKNRSRSLPCLDEETPNRNTLTEEDMKEAGKKADAERNTLKSDLKAAKEQIEGLRKELERGLECEQKGGHPPQSQSRSQECEEDRGDNTNDQDDELTVLQKQKEASDWNLEMLEMALAGTREEAALTKEASSRQLVCMSTIEEELEEELTDTKKELGEAKEKIERLQKDINRSRSLPGSDEVLEMALEEVTRERDSMSRSMGEMQAELKKHTKNEIRRKEKATVDLGCFFGLQ